MTKHIKPVFQIGLFSFFILFASCGSSKKIQYFQDVKADTLEELVVDPKIQVGDLLFINITATNAEAALPFNLYETPILGNAISAAKPISYLVDSDGNIQFPVLGALKVEGLSTKELTMQLKKDLVDFVKDSTINIRFANFRVSVLGEVNKPGAFPVNNERMSIIEAISLAGDLTIYGKRESVLLIRTINNEKTYITIDLTSKNILDSPYYYLKQNDVIYVAPNKTRANATAVGPNTSVIISSASLLITLLALILK